mmetsp:Transcript_20379/g.56691  ORF Transcript_20379/g.56691 Transcript_20379/m.56691 type:complete len:561 (+) Transcript_20379:109-1791(+)
MKLNFTGFLMVALAFVQAASTSPTYEDRHEVHRYLTEEEAECVLYLKVAEDHKTWTCRFMKQQADELAIPDTMEIEGVPEEFFESSVSGGSVMKFRDGAFVKQTPVASKSLGVMVISGRSEGSVEIRAMSNDDPRHYRNNRRTQGNFRTLVVRVIDSMNQEPESVETLRNEIFNDSFNMKTQYSACSKGQMTIEEAGIGDVKLDVVADKNIDIGSLAKAAAEKKYGGSVGLEKKYDFVMFCMPHDIVWAGYAVINSFDSYYGHPWCNEPHTQLHEIGHNLGLGHSSKDDDVYGDKASIMGGPSFSDDDGPAQCFNPAHNWKLRWYEKQQLSIKPMELSSPRTFVLNGIDDYKMNGSSNGELVILRLDYYGTEDQGWDYYVGYNRATGVNSGTLEAPDTVTVILKPTNGQYGFSDYTTRWNLPVGESFTITAPAAGLPDVYIDFKSVQNGGKDAIVVISNSGSGGPTPTMAPVSTPEPTPSFTSTSSSTSTLSCEDEPHFKLKGDNKKNCNWVAKGKKKLNKKKKIYKKIQKKCKRKVSGKKKVWDYCRETCSLVDMGPCA